MNKIQRSLILPYSARQLFDLVNDIESYPLFIPACIKAAVLSHTGNELIASLEFNKYGFHKKFTTKNTVEDAKYITMDLVEGPFSSLHGMWHFLDLNEYGCKVSLDLTFAISQRVLYKAFTPIVHKAVEVVIAAFCNRAHKLYAKK